MNRGWLSAARARLVRFCGAVLVLVPATGVRAERALSVGDAIAIVRANNSGAIQARLDVERADINVLRARLERAQLSIRATVTEQAQRLNVNGPPEVCALSPATCNNEAHIFDGSARLVVPAWSGFGVEAHIAGARAQKSAAQADEHTTLNALALEVAQAYWEVRRAELRFDVATRVLASSRRIEEITREKVNAGIAPTVDFNRAHVLVLREQEQLNTFESAAIAARARLGAVLELDDVLCLTDEPATPLALPALAVAERDALAARPDLRAAHARVEAQSQAVRAAKGAYWPQLDLVAQASAQNQPAYAPGTQESVVLGAIVGVRASWALFDGLSTWTTVREARVLREWAQADVDRLRHQVVADVRRSHGVLAKAIDRRALAQEATAAQRESVAILRQRYQVGGALLIELLLAQVDLANLEAELVDASIAIAQGQAQLNAALGNL
jgi:outer membrane protein TolC